MTHVQTYEENAAVLYRCRSNRHRSVAVGSIFSVLMMLTSRRFHLAHLEAHRAWNGMRCGGRCRLCRYENRQDIEKIIGICWNIFKNLGVPEERLEAPWADEGPIARARGSLGVARSRQDVRDNRATSVATSTAKAPLPPPPKAPPVRDSSGTTTATSVMSAAVAGRTTGNMARSAVRTHGLNPNPGGAASGSSDRPGASEPMTDSAAMTMAQMARTMESMQSRIEELLDDRDRERGHRRRSPSRRRTRSPRRRRGDSRRRSRSPSRRRGRHDSRSRARSPRRPRSQERRTSRAPQPRTPEIPPPRNPPRNPPPLAPMESTSRRSTMLARLWETSRWARSPWSSGGLDLMMP